MNHLIASSAGRELTPGSGSPPLRGELIYESMRGEGGRRGWRVGGEELGGPRQLSNNSNDCNSAPASLCLIRPYMSFKYAQRVDMHEKKICKQSNKFIHYNIKYVLSCSSCLIVKF